MRTWRIVRSASQRTSITSWGLPRCQDWHAIWGQSTPPNYHGQSLSPNSCGADWRNATALPTPDSRPFLPPISMPGTPIDGMLRGSRYQENPKHEGFLMWVLFG